MFSFLIFNTLLASINDKWYFQTQNMLSKANVLLENLFFKKSLGWLLSLGTFWITLLKKIFPCVVSTSRANLLF